MSPSAFGSDALHAGFLFDEFNLTLAPGHRTEAVGPFFYSEQKETQRIWAVPPLLSYTRDPETESKEFDILYPLMTYDRYGEQYRWQFFQCAELRRRPHAAGERAGPRSPCSRSISSNAPRTRARITRRSFRFMATSSTGSSGTKSSLSCGRLYSQTRKRDVVTDNYLVPFFSLRHGDGLHGWQFWPLIGKEHKEVTTQTNGFGDIKTIGGHDSFFALWPLFFNNRSGIGTTNAQWQQASLPAYSFLRSPQARLHRHTLAVLQLRG